jgi:hypothetical protein
MKYYGDIPKEHQELVKELERLENWFTEHDTTIHPLMAAKGLTCMAHDYYAINMEENGEDLLNRANKYYPGYFKNEIFVHLNKDPEYLMLVVNLINTEARDTMISLGFKDV